MSSEKKTKSLNCRRCSDTLSEGKTFQEHNKECTGKGRRKNTAAGDPSAQAAAKATAFGENKHADPNNTTALNTKKKPAAKWAPETPQMSEYGIVDCGLLRSSGEINAPNLKALLGFLPLAAEDATTWGLELVVLDGNKPKKTKGAAAAEPTKTYRFDADACKFIRKFGYHFLDGSRDWGRLVEIDASRVTTLVDAGYGTMCNFKHLRHIKLPSSVATYEDILFEDCSKLEVIDISNTKIKRINRLFARDCDQLKKVHLPPTVREIRDGFLSGCKNLREVTGLQCVNKIGKEFLSTSLPRAFPGVTCELGRNFLETVENTADIYQEGISFITVKPPAPPAETGKAKSAAAAAAAAEDATKTSSGLRSLNKSDAAAVVSAKLALHRSEDTEFVKTNVAPIVFPSRTWKVGSWPSALPSGPLQVGDGKKKTPAFVQPLLPLSSDAGELQSKIALGAQKYPMRTTINWTEKVDATSSSSSSSAKPKQSSGGTVYMGIVSYQTYDTDTAKSRKYPLLIRATENPTAETEADHWAMEILLAHSNDPKVSQLITTHENQVKAKDTPPLPDNAQKKVIFFATGVIDEYREGSSWDYYEHAQEALRLYDDGSWDAACHGAEGSTGTGDGGAGHGGTPGDGNVWHGDLDCCTCGTWTKSGESYTITSSAKKKSDEGAAATQKEGEKKKKSAASGPKDIKMTFAADAKDVKAFLHENIGKLVVGSDPLQQQDPFAVFDKPTEAEK